MKIGKHCKSAFLFRPLIYRAYTFISSHCPEGPVEEATFEMDLKSWEKELLVSLLHQSVPEKRRHNPQTPR